MAAQQWWVLFTGPNQSQFDVEQGKQVGGTVNGKNVRAGPYQTKAAAQAELKKLGGGSTSTGTGGGNCGKPSRSWDFGQWRNWANCKSSGAGDTWWAWVQAHQDQAQPPPPLKSLPPVKLTDHSYGYQTTAQVFLNSNNTTAGGWFGAWLLTITGTNLAQALADALNVLRNAAGSAGPALGNAVSIPNPLAAVGDFLSRLTQANTWIRVGEVLLGIVLLAVGVARLTNAVPAATKIAKTAAKVVPV